MLYLISLLFLNQAAAISCDDNNPCPWYTFADCCGHICWAFSVITNCDSIQCSACKIGAAAAVSAGGSVACDAVTVAACEAAGAGPEDPLADICAAASVAICTAVWNKGLNDPNAICQSVGMCSGMEEESQVPALAEASDNCMDCLETFENNGGCDARKDADYTTLKKAVPAQCEAAMKGSCRAQVPQFCAAKAEQKAKVDRLASAESLTQNCYTVGDTWDYCRWGPLRDPRGVEIIAGSTYTFNLNYASEKFHWTCSGSDEYSRIDRANVIETHYGTDGHIHWVGKACSGMDEEAQAIPPQPVATEPLTQNCYTVGDTWDYCRWGPLRDPTGNEIIAGSTVTFKLNFASEKFHWTCSGSDEWSRVDRANYIEAHYQTDGHIHWTGKACSGLESEKVVDTPVKATKCLDDGAETHPFCITDNCCNECCWGTSFPFLGKCCSKEEFEAQKDAFITA